MKYIVKNCPAFGITTPISCALTSGDSCAFTDCPIKQIVEVCKKEFSNLETATMQAEILKILQVEEVE